MFLAIDIGNTHCVYALHDGRRWLTPVRRETGHLWAGAGLTLEIESILAELQVEASQVSAVGVASVVPAGDDVLEKALAHVIGRPTTFITHDNSTIQIKYPHPEEVGADRLADVAGALAKYRPPLLIVDFGTATTFDYVDPNGAYLGGPIAPGVLLAQKALSAAAAKLPAIDFAATKQLIPQTTIEAMQSGIFYGTVGAVNHIITTMLKEVGTNPQLIATGGLAKQITPALSHKMQIEPLLTLEGIKIITNV